VINDGHQPTSAAFLGSRRHRKTSARTRTSSHVGYQDDETYSRRPSPTIRNQRSHLEGAHSLLKERQTALLDKLKKAEKKRSNKSWYAFRLILALLDLALLHIAVGK
jgi:hypothetical protein